MAAVSTKSSLTVRVPPDGDTKADRSGSLKIRMDPPSPACSPEHEENPALFSAIGQIGFRTPDISSFDPSSRTFRPSPEAGTRPLARPRGHRISARTDPKSGRWLARRGIGCQPSVADGRAAADFRFGDGTCDARPRHRPRHAGRDPGWRIPSRFWLMDDREDVMDYSNGLSRRGFLAAGAAAGAVLATPALAQGGTKVVIGMPGGTVAATLIEMIRQRDIFAQFDINGEFMVVNDGNKLTTGVMSGEIDLCPSSGFGQVLTAIEKGASLKVVSGASVLIPQALFSAKEDVRTLKDLEGRAVGTGAPGALLHNMTVALMKKQGVDWTKVNFVNVGSSAQVIKAVSVGTVDAGPAQIDIYSNMEPFGVHVVSEFWKELPEYPYQAGYSADKTIANKREGLVGALSVFGSIFDFLQNGDSLDAFLEANVVAVNADPAAAEAQWKWTQTFKPYDLLLEEDKIDYMQDLNLSLGIQKRKLDLPELSDFSMAREALGRLG
ncbi:ABC transporter substrate-binding protein [Sinirhodobacter populi]|uniref:ABC transporter substrate-binding protein n=2 Tax=Paenirhodobacter populi TaxID=2306993 RepID=A0A443K5T5_9RHOB|nr:ABC transporter substrate-binding protein [Sinirhodobacter populi]